MRVASIATCSERLDVLPDTVRSLANQVDKVHIYYNRSKDFKQQCHEATDLIGMFWEHGSKVEAYVVDDQADLSKFRAIWDYPDATIFTCDDDLIYSPDYCYEMEKKLFHQYSVGTQVLTVGGKIMNEGNLISGRGFKESISTSTNYLKVHGRGDNPIDIDIPSSSCAVFKASLFQDCKIDPKYMNASDIQLAAWIKERGYISRWLWGNFPTLVTRNKKAEKKQSLTESENKRLSELALGALRLRD